MANFRNFLTRRRARSLAWVLNRRPLPVSWAASLQELRMVTG